MNRSSSSTSDSSFLGPSLQIATVSSIPIRIHWSFSLLLLWVGFLQFTATSGPLAFALAMAFIVLVFFCVVLHELGHSLTAQYFGIQTRSITLSPIGGVAALERSPRNWKQELWITLAGPAVNVVIALILLPFVFLFAKPALLAGEPFAHPGNLVFMLFLANVMLAVFNMIPAFPMDGGRILRAVLTPLRGRFRATQIAARIGQGCAVGMAVIGLFFSPVLVLVSIFVFLAAAAELNQVKMDESLGDSTVSDAMRESFAVVDLNRSIEEVFRLALRYEQISVPVMDRDRFLGVVSLDALEKSRREGLGERWVGSILERDPIVVSPHDGLLETFRRMRQLNRDVVPVMRGTHLIGLLGAPAIVRLLNLKQA